VSIQLNTEKDELVDWHQVAELVKLKERAFWKLVHEQGLPYYRLNPRVIRFKLGEVQRWLASRRVGGAA
jgi:excisionase family DNA binding protein